MSYFLSSVTRDIPILVRVTFSYVCTYIHYKYRYMYMYMYICTYIQHPSQRAILTDAPPEYIACIRASNLPPPSPTPRRKKFFFFLSRYLIRRLRAYTANPFPKPSPRPFVCLSEEREKRIPGYMHLTMQRFDTSHILYSS